MENIGHIFSLINRINRSDTPTSHHDDVRRAVGKHGVRHATDTWLCWSFAALSPYRALTAALAQRDMRRANGRKYLTVEVMPRVNMKTSCRM
jgi:hypothetical protein